MSATQISAEQRAASTQWRRLLAALNDAGEQVFAWPYAQSSISQGQALRHMQRVLRGMFLTAIEQDDPDYPSLLRLFDSYQPYGNSNPDCTYFHATVSPRHNYRISGKRGTAKIVEVQVMDGHFVAGPNHKGLLTLPNLKADANGNLEIILSATPQPGNWVRLDAGASWLYMRQYYYDWETEIPAELVIERIGAQYPPPVISNAELARRMDRLIGWIPSWYRHLQRRVEGYYESPADSCKFVLSTAGMDGLHYGKGHFTFAADQAVIMEFRPPACDYWSFQIMNNYWESQDFDVRQTSLNGHQAVLDADGMFRAVISVTDPGVPNWLDPVGHLNGTICGRVLYPAVPPITSLRVVSLEKLREELPAETPSVSSSARSDTLRRRMLSVRRRYRE
jgi:hypothetical protein